jgi:hypothetical protein
MLRSSRTHPRGLAAVATLGLLAVAFGGLALSSGAQPTDKTNPPESAPVLGRPLEVPGADALELASPNPRSRIKAIYQGSEAVALHDPRA